VDHSTEIELIADTDFATDEVVALFESGSHTRQLLLTLPAEQRQIVALAFFKGLSHQEIALCCKMPLGTVKSQIKRALALLQKSNNNGLYQ
jgi:RNA polymerase sigma-70 factor (ECF subfamily)